MKHSSKKALLLTAIIAISSCNRFDRTSPLGLDVIGAQDSSAINFDGTYFTNKYLPTSSDFSSMTDPISGLHRYVDSLRHSGAIQKDIFVGKFYDEESYGYITFSKYDSAKTVAKHTASFYVDSLLMKENYASVTTELVLDLSKDKHSEEFYNIRIATGPYTPDSTRLDTTKFHTMQNVLIPGKQSRFVVDLPYHYYRLKPSDTVSLGKVKGMLISEQVDTIKTTIRRVTGKVTTLDSTKVAPTVIPAHTDTMRFEENGIVPQSVFSGFTATAQKLSDANGFLNEIYTRTRTENAVTITDTVYHSWKLAGPNDSVDVILYPRAKSVKRGVSKASTVDGVVIDTLTDTVTVYLSSKVEQYKSKVLETVKFGRAYTGQTSANDLDTLNLILKNTTNTVNPLLGIRNVSLRITGTTKSGVVDSARAITITPIRSTMTVFKSGAALSSTVPVIDGGLERFVRIKLNTLPFWNMMHSNNYQNIRKGIIQIPVKVEKTLYPTYSRSSMKLNYYMGSANLTNGQLLATKGISMSEAYSSDSSYLKLDILPFLRTQYADKGNLTPDSYLYIWLDGVDMGRLELDPMQEYLFTYLVQNKQ